MSFICCDVKNRMSVFVALILKFKNYKQRGKDHHHTTDRVKLVTMHALRLLRFERSKLFPNKNNL